MTTEAHRLKAQARLREAGGNADAAVNIIASMYETQEVLQNRLKALEAVEHRTSDYPRVVHLARLTDFTIAAANGNRRAAARMVLRYINPQLPDRLPDALETLARGAAKCYSDIARVSNAGDAPNDIDIDDLVADLER